MSAPLDPMVHPPTVPASHDVLNLDESLAYRLNLMITLADLCELDVRNEVLAAHIAACGGGPIGPGLVAKHRDGAIVPTIDQLEAYATACGWVANGKPDTSLLAAEADSYLLPLLHVEILVHGRSRGIPLQRGLTSDKRECFNSVDELRRYRSHLHSTGAVKVAA